jgi:hypothetical protein
MKLSDNQMFIEFCMNLVAQKVCTPNQMIKLSQSIKFQLYEYVLKYRPLMLRGDK